MLSGKSLMYVKPWKDPEQILVVLKILTFKGNSLIMLLKINTKKIQRFSFYTACFCKEFL